MKINKKVLIPLFATAMGLSVVGGVGGAVAWYQYNSRVTASYVGTSVVDTGVLQIATTSDNGQGGLAYNWGRDYYKYDENTKLTPVTFGGIESDALPGTAYTNPSPEAGYQAGYAGWEVAENGKQYTQFSLYFRSIVADASSAGDVNTTLKEGYKMVSRKVYLSDQSIFECVQGNNQVKVADEALRVHVAVQNENDEVVSSKIIAKTEHPVSDKLKLWGPLDLDGNGSADTYHDDLFHHDAVVAAGVNDGDEMVYGVKNDAQTTVAFDDLVAARDGEKIAAADADKFVFETSESAPVKVTFTIWLEGWELFANTSEATYAVNMWNPKYTAETEVKVGLMFDTGSFKGTDLVQ